MLSNPWDSHFFVPVLPLLDPLFLVLIPIGYGIYYFINDLIKEFLK